MAALDGVKVQAERAVTTAITEWDTGVWVWVVALKSESDPWILRCEKRIDRTEWRCGCQKQNEQDGNCRGEKITLSFEVVSLRWVAETWY